MDRIVMKNLAFFGYHGAMSEENVLGQKFFLDLTLFVDLKKAGTTDSVEDTVHYGEAYNIVKNIVENKQFMLIEKLAQYICEELIRTFEKIQEVEISVHKPEAPVAGIFDYFAVEMRRTRNA